MSGLSSCDFIKKDYNIIAISWINFGKVVMTIDLYVHSSYFYSPENEAY